ncbi:MAG: ribosome-associated translation inhibitor RaiA [Clostridia bacterium]|nr:ribosome-associated translation inhibitor RaiA [Clostridia bacterium]
MEIEINSKNYVVSEKLKEIIEKKVSKLDKYFNADAVVKVLCKKEGTFNKLELTVRSKGLFYRAEVTGENMYENIDQALPKVERQIVKYGDKFFTRLKKDSLNKDYLFFDELPEMKRLEVVKKKTFELEPISVEDAKIFLDTIDNNFYVFLNRETNNVNILYRRNDGNLGLIETIY